MGLGNSTRSGGSIVKSVSKAADGHAYYLIQGNLESGVANVKFLDFYYGLAPYSPVTNPDGTAEQVGSVDGFFFVRNAADGHVKGDGKGDPTVHAGWAMYIWDPQDYIKRKPATNAGWVKIAQQGDVDWDITDELKAMFVLKTTFNARTNEVDNRFAQDEAITKGINVRLLNIEKDWDEGDDVHGKAHWHENKDTLDLLSEKYQSLYFRGKPISGNSYVYDHVEWSGIYSNKFITWCDPTKEETSWTHEIVKNSDEIARRLLETDLARVGLSLFVMEVDGSISIYKYEREYINGGQEGMYNLPVNSKYDNTLTYFEKHETTPGVAYYTVISSPTEPDEESLCVITDNEGNKRVARRDVWIKTTSILTYKFAQTIVADNIGLAEYVTTLPTASQYYLGRGAWVPLEDDGEHVVGHLHKCVETIDSYADATEKLYKSERRYFTETDDVYTEITDHSLIVLDRTGTWGYIMPESEQVNLGYKKVYIASSFTYAWVDLHDSGASIAASGAEISLCYAEDTTLWKDVKVFWKDPEDTTEGGIPIKWAKTILVRKVGSAPQHANDGVQVVISTTRNQYRDTAFCDTLPFSNQNVYYRAFSVSKSGGYFASTTAWVADKLTWTDIQNVISAGDAAHLFAIGDTIVLPTHAVYGDIECEVVAINQDVTGAARNSVLVVAKDVLCQKVVDAAEGKLDGDGNINPEWSDNFGAARGSNGVVSGTMHKFTSTNIWCWLNSTEASWYEAQTNWDTAPTYSTEPGFLAGFDSSMLSLFLTMSEVSDSTNHDFVPESVVSLPRYGSSYFNNITRAKQLGRDSAAVEWVTTYGSTSTYTETQRMNYGFKTVKNATEYGSMAPEQAVGIVPMFLLGKRS